MDELIERLTSQLGIDSSVASSATGKAMALVKEHAGDDLFAKISGAIPGLGEAADAGAAPAEGEDGGGGLLGSLAGAASSLLGDSAGDAVELSSSLGAAGLDTGQIAGFASTVIEFLKEKVGEELIDQVLEKVPMLKALID